MGIPYSIITIGPLFIALLDRLLYKVTLRMAHLFGFLVLIASSCMISLAQLVDEKVFHKDASDSDVVYKY